MGCCQSEMCTECFPGKIHDCVIMLETLEKEILEGIDVEKNTSKYISLREHMIKHNMVDGNWPKKEFLK